MKKPNGKNNNRVRMAVVISDVHVGSHTGLWPDNFKGEGGFLIGQNPFQEWLWECWTDFRDRWLPSITGDDPYALVCNGDLVEGLHHRATDIMSAAVADQLSAVIGVLGKLVKPGNPLFITLGTECHTRNDENVIGMKLGAVPDPETGWHAWGSLPLTIAGCLCDFSHHTPTTSRPYLEASQHSIQLGVATHEAGRNGYRIPKVIARAHRHRHGVWNDGCSLSVVTGAWQGITRFGKKVVPSAVPNPSVIVLDWRNVPDGELPIVHQRVYRPEEPQGVSL